MIELGEFARQKGISEERALELVEEGRYHGREVDGVWYIDPRRVRMSSHRILTGEMPALKVPMATDEPPAPAKGPSVPVLLVAVVLLLVGLAGAVFQWPDPSAFIWIAGGFVSAILVAGFAIRGQKV